MEEEWNAGWVRSIALQLSGRTVDHVDALGQQLTDDTFLLMLNPHWEQIDFYMPKLYGEKCWQLVLNTAQTKPDEAKTVINAGDPYPLVSHSMALFEEIED